MGEKAKIMRVASCAFREEMLSNVHIFRIPEEAGSRLFVDDSFKQAVQAAHLEGLAFYEVPLAAP